MNTAPTVPAYLTKEGGAVYVTELPSLRGIRFFNATCFDADGEEFANFPSVAEGTLQQTAELFGWIEALPQSVQSVQVGREQNPGSSAAYLGHMEHVDLTSDENGWELILYGLDGNVYRANIHAAAEGLLDQMGRVQDWLAGA